MTFSNILIFGLPIAALIFTLFAFAVKIIDLKKQVDGLRAALFTLERNTNEKTKELQSKLDALTALKICFNDLPTKKTMRRPMPNLQAN